MPDIVIGRLILPAAFHQVLNYFSWSLKWTSWAFTVPIFAFHYEQLRLRVNAELQWTVCHLRCMHYIIMVEITKSFPEAHSYLGTK